MWKSPLVVWWKMETGKITLHAYMIVILPRVFSSKILFRWNIQFCFLSNDISVSKFHFCLRSLSDSTEKSLSFKVPFVISTKIQTINKLHFNFTRKHLCWSLFLIKLQALKGCNFIKNSPTQMFSYEYCEIFNNTYFEEHLRTAASVHLKLGFLKIGLLKSSLEFSC